MNIKESKEKELLEGKIALTHTLTLPNTSKGTACIAIFPSQIHTY